MDPVEITEDRVNPHTTYGISKYAAELTSLSLGKKYNIPCPRTMHGQWRYGCVGGHGEGDGERLHVAPNSRGINTETKAIRRIFSIRMIGDDGKKKQTPIKKVMTNED